VGTRRNSSPSSSNVKRVPGLPLSMMTCILQASLFPTVNLPSLICRISLLDGVVGNLRTHTNHSNRPLHSRLELSDSLTGGPKSPLSHSSLDLASPTLSISLPLQQPVPISYSVGTLLHVEYPFSGPLAPHRYCMSCLSPQTKGLAVSPKAELSARMMLSHQS